LHVGQRDTTVDLRVGFDTGGVVKVRSAPPSCLIPRHPLMPSAPSSAPLAQSNWAIKRQTNDIPAQVHLASSSPLRLDRQVGPKTGRTEELTRTLSFFLSLSRARFSFQPRAVPRAASSPSSLGPPSNRRSTDGRSTRSLSRLVALASSQPSDLLIHGLILCLLPSLALRGLAPSQNPTKGSVAGGIEPYA
jgi:hypothetical protein